MSDPSKQLREVAQIAEAHFVKTFGTDRIAAVRETAQLLAEARELIEPIANGMSPNAITLGRFLAKLKAASGEG